MNLCGLHLVCVDPEPACLADLIGALEQQHCTVHVARNHFQGLALYWQLYKEDKIPRALLTEWNLVPPRSREQRFYETIGRPLAGTSAHLIQRARQLDPSVAVVVMTYDLDAVPDELGVFTIEKNRTTDILARLESVVQTQNYHHRHSEIVAL